MTLKLLSLQSLHVAFVIGSASVVPGVSGDSGFLSFPIQHAHHIRSIGSFTRRDADVTLFNVSALSYLIELSIGTPGQNVKVAIDTGSDELWVDPNCRDSTLTPDQEQECTSDGVYSQTKSSTSSTANISATSNTIPYGKGEVNIDYVRDDISLPGSGASLKNVQFGVATASQELNEGILGIGFGLNKDLNYSNFIDELAAQKVTNSKAFSVALGSVDANNGGVIIFGGIDTKKFSGKLITNPILGPQSRVDINRYYVQMNSIGLSRRATSKTYSGGSAAVVLDSGSSLSYLPSSVFKGMASDFQAQLDQSSGVYLVPCSQRTQGGTIDFTFGQGTINVPVANFIWQVDTQDCVLGAMPADPNSGVSALLGDTFLRSVYAIFDQTTNTISMAPYTNCGQNEQSIPASGAANFTGQCGSTNAADRSASGSGSAGLLFAALVSIVLVTIA
ncbi:putative eukaryotic aspartyl protease [Diplogelasinospora grovesii]|uniref:Eukaryotic aspartyl protease n=1 Tax=Diplogelasinospora grovesii TaxID=303347 RepID=A0AAN6N1E2_9PEZI|nr:putative eukaryotic aspartyl protease [Diplogelasinospora grovesii]